MNIGKTVAMVFCPTDAFLFQNGQPILFPIRYVFVVDHWVTEPVDPSGGLVPIPDCIRKYCCLGQFTAIEIHFYVN